MSIVNRKSSIVNPRQPGLARSVLEVPASRIRELAEIAMSMDGVLRLYFGESNLPTPAYIKAAAVQALHDGFTFYTENAGLPSLRQAIADKYREIHGVDLDAMRRIVVTASGVQALNVSIRCLLDPGDEALVLTPAWPNGAAIVQMCSARVIEIPHLLRVHRYEIDFAALESAIGQRTRMILYTSPSNPLGWVATESDQRRLLEVCRRHRLWLLADEVYERLYYGGPVAPSILRHSAPDDAVIVTHSFSKSYCMTGWRLGWLVSRPDLAQKATQLNEFIVSHAPSMAQRAAEAALKEGEDELRAMVQRLRENRDFARSALQQMPRVTVPQPEGAFYLFPRIEGIVRLVRILPAPLDEKKGGNCPRRSLRSGGRRIGSNMLCGRSFGA